MIINTPEFLGHATITPSKPVRAGEMGTWTITYTVGKYGFDDAGCLRVAWRTVSDWGTPQFDRPKETGYSSVSTTGAAKITPCFDIFQRPYNNSVLLRLSDGFLVEGDKVILTLGDTSKGSPGIRAQTYVESAHMFKVLVDCMGTKVMEEIPNQITIPVESGPIHKVEAVIRPTVTIGKPFDILIRAIDEFGNACTHYEGDVTLSIPELKTEEYQLPVTVTFSKEDKGSKRVSGCVVNKAGSFHVETKNEAQHLPTVISNGATAGPARDYNLYFGDMHGQTNFTLGTGTVEEYYTFARDIGAVDFAGWQGNDLEIDDDEWKSVRESTKAFNDPGKFVVFLGYEWSGITPRGGDHNVFFLNDNKDFYPSSNALAPKTDINKNAPFLSDLYKFFAGRKDVMTIAHVGGRHGNFDFFNPNFTPVVEIHSHHGTFEWFAKDAMRRRMKVGFVGASDDHTGRLGLSYPLTGAGNNLVSFDVGSGYSGVYAKSLTREDIWEALHSRRCFASDSGRIQLEVFVDGHWMGEEITCSNTPEIEVKAVGSNPIDTFQLFDWDNLILTKNMRPKSKRRVQIRWSGVRVRTRKKSACWDGSINVKNGRILGAEPYAFDRTDQGLRFVSDQRVEWVSSTSGDYDGVILDLDANEDTKIYFDSVQTNFAINFKDITDKPVIFEAGGENLKVEVLLANEPIKDNAERLAACAAQTIMHAPETKESLSAYWVRVLLEDGHMAWSSPVYVNYKK